MSRKRSLTTRHNCPIKKRRATVNKNDKSAETIAVSKDTNTELKSKNKNDDVGNNTNLSKKTERTRGKKCNKNHPKQNNNNKDLPTLFSEESDETDSETLIPQPENSLINDQTISRWTSSKEIRGEMMYKNIAQCNLPKNKGIQCLARSDEPINTFCPQKPRIEIPVKRHVFNPYTNTVMDVMKNPHEITPSQHHSNSIQLDGVHAGPRTCNSRDVGHQNGSILRNNQNPGKLSNTIKRLSSIQLYKKPQVEIERTNTKITASDGKRESNPPMDDKIDRTKEIDDSCSKGLSRAKIEIDTKGINEILTHNPEPPKKKQSDSPWISYTESRPYSFRKNKHLSENQILSYDLRFYSIFTYIFFVLFDDRKELLDALFIFTSKLREFEHIKDECKTKDHLLCYKIFMSMSYASAGTDKPGLLDLVFTMVLFRASIQFNRKTRFFYLNKYSIIIQDSLDLKDDRVFALFEFNDQVDLNALNRTLDSDLIKNFLCVIYSIVKYRTMQHYISLNIRSNPLLLIHVVKQRSRKTQKERTIAKTEKYIKKMERSLAKGRGKDDIALIVVNGEDRTAEILADEKLKKKRKEKRRKRKLERRQRASFVKPGLKSSKSTETSKIDPKELFTKNILPISDSGISFDDLKVSYDFDYFNIFIKASSNFKIFRTRHTPNIAFNKMFDSVPKFKTSLFIETKDKCKKISDFLLLNFANSDTSIGKLFFNFIVDSDYDNNSRREIIAKKIIVVANKYVKELISSNIKYCTTKKNFASVYVPGETTEFERAFLEYDCFGHGRNMSGRKREVKNRGELIIPEDKQITDFKKMSSDEFSKILVYIFGDVELNRVLKGIYISGVGTKESCNTEKTPADLHAMVTNILNVESFDLFTVDAAVQFCVKNKEKVPYTLFFDPSSLTYGSKKGICNTFGSECTKNIHVTNVRYNSQTKKLEIPSHGLLKINFYSTLISTLFPRSLKLSRALQFSGIGLFFFICDRIGFKKPDVRFLDLLDDIRLKGVKMMNSHFGYRFEGTILFDTASEWQTAIFDNLKKENKFSLYKTNELVELLSDYIQDLKSSVLKEREKLSELSTLCIKEILIVQHIFQGRPNTHQLRNKEILSFLKRHLLMRSHISGIDITRVCSMLHKFIDPESIEERAKLIISKCYQLSSNCRKIVGIYDQLIKVKTSSDLTQLFLKVYNDAFRVKTEQKKMERMLTDSSDLKRITINEYYSMLLDSRREYDKFTKRKKLSLIARMIRWLHDNKITAFLAQLEKIFLANNTEPLIGIYDNCGISFFYILVKDGNHDSTYRYSLEYKSTKKYDKKTGSPDLIELDDVNINGLPRYVIEHLIHHITLQKEGIKREEHTISEKSRVMAGAHFYGKIRNLHIKIHNDVRFGLFGLKSPEQIRTILKAHRSAINKQSISEALSKTLTSIEKNARKFRLITDFSVFERIYAEKKIILHGEHEYAFKIMSEHLIGNKSLAIEKNETLKMNEYHNDIAIEIENDQNIGSGLSNGDLHETEENQELDLISITNRTPPPQGKTNVMVKYGKIARKRGSSRRMIVLSDESNTEDIAQIGEVAAAEKRKNQPLKGRTATTRKNTIKKRSSENNMNVINVRQRSNNEERNKNKKDANNNKSYKAFIKCEKITKEVKSSSVNDKWPDTKKEDDGTSINTENTKPREKINKDQDETSKNNKQIESHKMNIIMDNTGERDQSTLPLITDDRGASSSAETTKKFVQRSELINSSDDQPSHIDPVNSPHEDVKNTPLSPEAPLNDTCHVESSISLKDCQENKDIPNDEGRHTQLDLQSKDTDFENSILEQSRLPQESLANVGSGDRFNSDNEMQNDLEEIGCEEEIQHSSQIIEVTPPENVEESTKEIIGAKEERISTKSKIHTKTCSKGSDNAIPCVVEETDKLPCSTIICAETQSKEISSHKTNSTKGEESNQENLYKNFYFSQRWRKSLHENNKELKDGLPYLELKQKDRSISSFIEHGEYNSSTAMSKTQISGHTYSLPSEFINGNHLQGMQRHFSEAKGLSFDNHNLQLNGKGETVNAHDIWKNLVHNSSLVKAFNEQTISHIDPTSQRRLCTQRANKTVFRENQDDGQSNMLQEIRENSKGTGGVTSHEKTLSMEQEDGSRPINIGPKCSNDNPSNSDSFHPHAAYIKKSRSHIDFTVNKPSAKEQEGKEKPHKMAKIFDETIKFSETNKEAQTPKKPPRTRRALDPDIDLNLNSKFMHNYLKKLRSLFKPGSVICFTQHHQSIYSSHIRPNKKETEHIVKWLLENEFILPLQDERGLNHRYFRISQKLFDQ